MPDASSSRVGADGTGEPGVKARMVAPPARVPASASRTVNGVTAPAERASLELKAKRAIPLIQPSNWQRFFSLFLCISLVLFLFWDKSGIDETEENRAIGGVHREI